MSRSFGYICLSHEPNIASDHWFNWGDDLLKTVFSIERAGLWPNLPLEEWEKPGDEDPEYVRLNSHVTREPIYWLRQHPNCEIGLHDEYGEIHKFNNKITPQAALFTFRELVIRTQRYIDLLESVVKE